jgi:hypothetical protein
MQSGLHMKILGAKVLSVVGALLVMSPAPVSAADPVTDAFYVRCVSENSYQMQPGELEEACACMAPVMVSFLTADARRTIEDAIKSRKPVSLSGNPFQGDPAQLARSAIRQCPAVGEAMYRRECAGGNEAAPHCQEMRDMIDQVP